MHLRKTTAALATLSLQMLVACGGVAAEESAAGQAEARTRGYEPPVRVSRGYFEAPLSAEVRVKSPERPSAAIYSSTVKWAEYPPTDPPPTPTEQTGPVLADFRDHQGCARMSEAGDWELCFRMMGDVDSVGINGKDVTPKGLDQWIDRELDGNCRADDWKTSFVRGARDGQKVIISYEMDREVRPGCAQGPIQVDVVLAPL